MPTTKLSDEWLTAQAQRLAEIHLSTFEPMSVNEILEGVPEWDELFKEGDPDYDLIDEYVDKIYDLVMNAEVHIPNKIQRYLET